MLAGTWKKKRLGILATERKGCHFRLLLGETLEKTVGILLTLSLLGGAGETKIDCICQEYTISELESCFQKSAV